MHLMEAILEPDVDAHENALPSDRAATDEAAAAKPRVDYVLAMLAQLANRQRLRTLAVLYNEPHGLELAALASALDAPEEQAQTLADRLVRAGLVTLLPVLDDASLGWRTRYLATPAAREWLDRVALANGREALVPA